MKNIFNKLKKTISFYVLILSMLFFLVGLVLKCIYLYEYNRLEKDITNAIDNKQVYKYAYGGNLNGETIYGTLDFSDSAYFKSSAYENKMRYTNRNAILYQLEMEGKRFCISYNNFSNKIFIVCVFCFCVFGYFCYIKLHPEKKIKVDQKNINRVNTNNTISYLSDKPVVKCPYCHSKNTKKISTTSKAINTAMFGVLGTKRHKQWHCNNCSSDF